MKNSHRAASAADTHAFRRDVLQGILNAITDFDAEPNQADAVTVMVNEYFGIVWPLGAPAHDGLLTAKAFGRDWTVKFCPDADNRRLVLVKTADKATENSWLEWYSLSNFGKHLQTRIMQEQVIVDAMNASSGRGAAAESAGGQEPDWNAPELRQNPAGTWCEFLRIAGVDGNNAEPCRIIVENIQADRQTERPCSRDYMALDNPFTLGNITMSVRDREPQVQGYKGPGQLQPGAGEAGDLDWFITLPVPYKFEQGHDEFQIRVNRSGVVNVKNVSPGHNSSVIVMYDHLIEVFHGMFRRRPRIDYAFEQPESWGEFVEVYNEAPEFQMELQQMVRGMLVCSEVKPPEGACPLGDDVTLDNLEFSDPDPAGAGNCVKIKVNVAASDAPANDLFTVQLGLGEQINIKEVEDHESYASKEHYEALRRYVFEVFRQSHLGRKGRRMFGE